ncbi:MAG: DUF2914 domain-containing protein [candidate division KSB1 bacterium]|nr:DUF2914 domain-containing protein [candidate division KSB1 bacterium]MDZ7294566.1 DUF2914 domain-containing protein [candidate division KSB1 bacterium]MDZ7386009.1 DUF2914 domain-containing protein [candidate division KSB1 bacterium]MDZ7392388.1 DUF2914 domain-containing protein [candidate division KSB1 bacterium]MDZ7414458.1 DUF2914 domain-containing protein [candidate division KSB1 bacterium]
MANKLTYAVVGLVGLFVLLQLIVPPERRSSRRAARREVRTVAPTEQGKRSKPLFSDHTSRSVLRVTQLQICRRVEGLEPVEGGARFPANVGTLYCFTEVQGASRPEVIYHEWQYGGGRVTSVPLSVEDDSWRTWSKKSIRPSQVGAWQVKVRDSQGRLLGQTRFEIVAGGR